MSRMGLSLLLEVFVEASQVVLMLSMSNFVISGVLVGAFTFVRVQVGQS